MKKLWRIYHHSYMIRPTVYRFLVKSAVVLLLAVLWNQFINNGLFTIGYAFLALGLICMALAWFNYLSLDGVHVNFVFLDKIKEHRSKQRQHIKKDMVDYVQEPVVSFDELEPEERSACGLMSSFLTGLLFALLSLFF
ncbi:MAG: hypothetical protein LIO78_03310 [Clostridiales bacterium]|nr:hypothetical protein [Clostridiales bacterium]MCC8099080.1 hypothetical protein [Clostridiales bacterium]